MSRPTNDAKILALTGTAGTALCVLVLVLTYGAPAAVFCGLAVLCNTLALVGMENMETSSRKRLTR